MLAAPTTTTKNIPNGVVIFESECSFSIHWICFFSLNQAEIFQADLCVLCKKKPNTFTMWGKRRSKEKLQSPLCDSKRKTLSRKNTIFKSHYFMCFLNIAYVYSMPYVTLANCKTGAFGPYIVVIFFLFSYMQKKRLCVRAKDCFCHIYAHIDIHVYYVTADCMCINFIVCM